MSQELCTSVRRRVVLRSGHQLRFGFITLQTNKCEASPEFSCLGRQWKLKIYPGSEENSAEGQTAIGIVNISDKSIKIEYGFSIKDADGKEVVHKKPHTVDLAAHGSGGSNGSCYNLAKRSKIMKSLMNDGTLVIDVRMRLVDTNKSTPPFVPQNPINKNVLELLDDE